MFEAIEKVLTTELLEQNVFKLPGIATLFRKELPARPDMGEKYVYGRLVKVPARSAIYKAKIAVSIQLKASMAQSTESALKSSRFDTFQTKEKTCACATELKYGCLTHIYVCCMY